ncbi:MAG: hypothetical protein E7020_03865 [Alphaproteobacteria bacterium]|nr:hypothetical protein [Alphaproteobacteria bacterium]
MKKFLSSLFIFVLLPCLCLAEDPSLPQNFLFDDSDIIIKAPEKTQKVKTETNENDKINAINQAKNLLEKQPTKLQSKNLPKTKIQKSYQTNTPSYQKKFKEAPFGLLWEASIADTRNQGVQLSATNMKDYTNSFLANHLPKPISFFDKIYLVFGKEDALYRILAYSQLINDDASASIVLKQYDTFSELLNKKYGNKETFFTPTIIVKTIRNAQDKEEKIEEKAPLGNPEFLSQLQAGTSMLYSTYYNDDVAAALSISVDGDKKSYIVIDYKNLNILKKQEAKTLDAL